MDYATLVKTIPGYTGWGEVEALADYAATGGAGKERASGDTGGIDMSQVPSVQEYVKGQFAGEDVALKQLVMAMQGREQPLDVYTRLETEAGLPEMRTTATTLMKEISAIEDYLDQIAPDITARTRESLVTEAQRRGMVEVGKEPYIERLGKFGTALGRLGERMGVAERGIATKAELAVKGQEMGLEPLQLQYQVMVDRNARLLTGFTEDRQLQLDVMWDKLQRERYLSDQEWALANTLAQEERQYMKSLATTAASAGVTLTGKETADDILALIGTTAAEVIKYERSMEEKRLAVSGAAAGRGTESERAAAQALTSLRRDVAAGATFEDVMRRYGPTGAGLPTYQVREEYNAASRYGPAKETEPEIMPWTLKPKAEETSGITVNPDGSINIK